MKRIVFAVLAISALFTCAAYAEEVTLPDFEVRLNGTLVDSEYREYPMLQYKNIIYFPMTYYDCRLLSLDTDWDNDTRTLRIRLGSISGMYRDYASEIKNAERQTVEVCDFNIVVNGKTIDNAAEEYPLLTFRGVTYFPLTWRFVHDVFLWEYSYTDDGGLVIDADNYHTKIIDLPNYDGKGIAFDGEAYYYQGADYHIYRAWEKNLRYAEAVHYIAYDKLRQSYPIVKFEKIDGQIYFHYHMGNASMGNEFWYMLSPGEAPAEVDYWNSFQHVRSRWPESEYHFGDTTVKTRSLDYGTSVSYSYNEYNEEAVLTGIELHKIYVLGDRIYLTGAGNGVTNIYRINMKENSVEKLVEDIYDGEIFPFTRSADPTDVAGHRIMFYRDDAGMMLCSGKDGEYDYRGYVLKLPIKMAFQETDESGVPTSALLLVLGDENRTTVLSRDYYGYGSLGYYYFNASGPVTVVELDDAVYAHVNEEDPDVISRFVVVGKNVHDFHPYSSSDMADNVFVNENILLYTVDGKIVKVELNERYNYWKYLRAMQNGM